LVRGIVRPFLNLDMPTREQAVFSLQPASGSPLRAIERTCDVNRHRMQEFGGLLWNMELHVIRLQKG
jgi:hypothetical protein